MKSALFRNPAWIVFFGIVWSIGLAAPPAVDADELRSARNLCFTVSFPEGYSGEPLTGRMFVIMARNGGRQPRMQVGRYGVQLFGVDFENLRPGQKVVFDDTVLGYPVGKMSALPAGDYVVQAVLNKYTRFDRADDHTVWLHMDQWEGQRWTQSPGNTFSMPMKITIAAEAKGKEPVALETTEIIPPIEPPKDTEWVKRFRIQSKILSEFWGHPIMIGATILLPKGYEEHPDVHYPTVYQHGHFSTRNPFGFSEQLDNEFSGAWNSSRFPRFIAVTIQHPTPYYDDSYAVNSANNGPYGDAIHEELIPEIERRFRCIPKSYARVLTGGSTGGWESFALQVFYPDFYGGTWSFSPDPLDFRNVEGINIYEYKNAFEKEYEWYKVPIINTRVPGTGEIRLTSRQRITMELVNGTKGRSGQQLDVWSSVYGPVGEDGYTKPLFDKVTGDIDPEVAAYWKENYDLRHIMESRWESLGPKLVDKIHVICGEMDNFFLNLGVRFMEEFLMGPKNPYRTGTFTYGVGGHGWRPFSSVELLQTMARHITAYAPEGEDTSVWRY
jgi:hypothetical protein